MRLVVTLQSVVLPLQFLPGSGRIFAVQLFGQIPDLADRDFALFLVDVAVHPVGELFLRRVFATAEPCFQLCDASDHCANVYLTLIMYASV